MITEETMTYQSIKLLNQMERKQKYDNIILRRKRYAVIVGLLLSFALGMATMWLSIGSQIDQASDEARMSERTEITRTLLRCARTDNFYEIPGSNVIFEPKISPKGLRIIDLKNAKQRASRAGQ